MKTTNIENFIILAFCVVVAFMALLFMGVLALEAIDAVIKNYKEIFFRIIIFVVALGIFFAACYAISKVYKKY